MRRSSIFAIAILVLFAGAQPVRADDTRVVERGSAVLTLKDIDARMQRLADYQRADFAHRPENLARMMDQMLMNRQLANEARELGIDADPKVSHDMVLAAEEVLATHRMNELVAARNLPDFEQLARERYLSDPSAHVAPGHRAVRHVLIGTESRDQDEALRIAHEVRAKAVTGVEFSELVEQFSDDPGKKDNQGRYELREPGVFVQEFEQASNELVEVGQLSEPVQTEFGFHILRLEELNPDRQLSFEEVRSKLIDELREAHLQSTRERHLAQLRSLTDHGDEELLRSLRQRYGGEAEFPRPSRTPVN